MELEALPQDLTETGTSSFACLICFREQSQVLVDGDLVYGGKIDGSSEYTAWYDREVGRSHEHDWVRYGIFTWDVQARGEWGGEACDVEGGTYGAISALPDPATARRFVLGLLNSSGDERRAVLLEQRASEGLAEFRSLAKVSKNQFPQAWQTFLEKYPDWRRVYERGL